MKAPDKICVAPHQIFDYDLEIQEVGHNGAEEYIRKDALIEWAKEMQNSPLKNTTESADKHRLSKMIIDKISSL